MADSTSLKIYCRTNEMENFKFGIRKWLSMRTESNVHDILIRNEKNGIHFMRQNFEYFVKYLYVHQMVLASGFDQMIS